MDGRDLLGCRYERDLAMIERHLRVKVLGGANGFLPNTAVILLILVVIKSLGERLYLRAQP
jgi:hypothetical protein